MAKAGNNTKDRCRHCGEPLVFVVRSIDFPDPRRYDENNTMVIRNKWVHARSVDGFTDKEMVKCQPKEDEEEEPSYRRSRAAPLNFCAETVRDEYDSICNRPVQDNDVHACGIHAGNLRESWLRAKKNSEERELKEYINQQVAVLVEKLKELGLKTATTAHYSQGYVEVEASELYRWLVDLKSEDADVG